MVGRRGHGRSHLPCCAGAAQVSDRVTDLRLVFPEGDAELGELGALGELFSWAAVTAVAVAPGVLASVGSYCENKVGELGL